MKLSISTVTTRCIAEALIEGEVVKRMPLREVLGYKNFSAQIINDEYVVEVNDVLIIKYLGLVVKLSRLINSAMQLMQTDINDLVELALKRK